MPGSGPAGGRGGPNSRVRPKLGGGFSSTLGSPDQHQDEAAMKAAVKQKQLQQQSSIQAQSNQNPFQTEKPREIKGLKEELIKRPIKDIKKGLASLVDLSALFNIESRDSPEEKAKKQQLHQRFQQLNQEQQAVAKKNYQEKLQKKKQELEEEQRRKEAEQARQAEQGLPLPTSPQKGPIGPAAGMSRKQKAQTNLQQQRQGLGPVGQKY